VSINGGIRANTLLVTARHRLTVGAGLDRAWRPSGRHHARRAGESRTQCGIVAIEWVLFWDMRFDPGDKHSCSECAYLVTVAAHDVRNRRESTARGDDSHPDV
jgi:hypothetical protein